MVMELCIKISPGGGMQPRLLGALHYGTAPFEMVAGGLLTQQSCDCFIWDLRFEISDLRFV